MFSKTLKNIFEFAMGKNLPSQEDFDRIQRLNDAVDEAYRSIKPPKLENY